MLKRGTHGVTEEKLDVVDADLPQKMSLPDITSKKIKDALAEYETAKKMYEDKQKILRNNKAWQEYKKWRTNVNRIGLPLQTLPDGTKRMKSIYKKNQAWIKIFKERKIPMEPPIKDIVPGYGKVWSDFKKARMNKDKKWKSFTDAKDKDNMCDSIRETFKQETSPGIWKWHKNKSTAPPMGTPIMYFTQKFKYRGKEYIALAHIHGYWSGNTWRYDLTGAPDKLEIFRTPDASVCDKDASFEHKLHGQIDATEFTANGRDKRDNDRNPWYKDWNRKWSEKDREERWPARYAMDNMYDGYDGFDEFEGTNQHDIDYSGSYVFVCTMYFEWIFARLFVLLNIQLNIE